MGASGSSIKNYQLGQPYFLDGGNAALKVTVYPATNVIDGQKYTVFQFAKENGRLSELAERYIEVLKTTRHPYVLKYLALFSDSSNETVVTEHVIPLDVAVEKQEKEEVCAGLRNVLEALLFLHERSSICHNGISVSSIFVSDNGEWKLASFENSSKVLRLSKQSFTSDITGFCEFALSVLEYLKDDSETTSEFMSRLEEESTAENKEVCTLRAILDDPFFKFPYLEALDGIQNLALKSNAEKMELFRNLPVVLHGLTPYVVCHRFIPLLFSHMVLTDPVANEIFMPNLFASGNDYCADNSIQPLFDHDHFIKYSLPKILALYELRDVTVRLTIMKYLPMYVDCIDKEILQEEILPELLTGLKDTNDKLVQETFLALASIVAILGGNVVVGGESHTFFYDRNPDFSRAPHEERGISTSTKVSDVIKPKKYSKSSVSVDKDTERTKEVLDERKQKRLERERQREEQRRIREQRKVEREAAKVKREQERSMDEEVDVNAVNSQQSEVEVVQSNDSVDKSDENDSEAEWEGFEVMSNASDQEWNDATELVSPVTGYNGNEGDNDIELLPIHNQNETGRTSIKKPTPSSSSSHSKQQELPFKESDNEILEYINSQLTSGMSTTKVEENRKSSVKEENRKSSVKEENRKSSVKEENRKSRVKEELEQNNAKSKGMSLSVKTKTTKPKTDSTDKAITSLKDEKDKNKSEDKIKKKDVDLGNEFDIKINKNKFTMEPDYFADMAPSFGGKGGAVSTVYINKDVGVSSKFSMDLSVEESSGWDDDGWENEEEIF